MIAAGKLDRRITLLGITGAVDDGYTSTPGWATMATVWAQYLPGAGQERTEQAERSATIVETFRIRWSSDVADLTPSDRLVFQDRTYDIKSAVELGRREAIEIKAVARADGGT
jgi:SPP1 family predicted phage head-tail adaptor